MSGFPGGSGGPALPWGGARARGSSPPPPKQRRTETGAEELQAKQKHLISRAIVGFLNSIQSTWRRRLLLGPQVRPFLLPVQRAAVHHLVFWKEKQDAQIDKIFFFLQQGNLILLRLPCLSLNSLSLYIVRLSGEKKRNPNSVLPLPNSLCTPPPLQSKREGEVTLAN